MTRGFARAIVLSATLAGCGAASVEDDAAPREDDAGFDAGMTFDAGVDAPDAVVDLDVDGVPAGSDCDDTDPAIGATATRPCSNSCGDGTEECTGGAWGVCSAPTDCMCSTPGAMRVASCGWCGMRSERCGAAGLWEPVGACIGEGECEAASIETRSTTRCGMEQRLCTTSCTWTGWETTVPDGECQAGMYEDRVCPGTPFAKPYLCGPDCRWVMPCV
jgi:hypothetical protein